MVKLNSLSFSINIPKPKKNKDVNTIKIVAKDIMGKVFIDKDNSYKIYVSITNNPNCPNFSVLGFTENSYNLKGRKTIFTRDKDEFGKIIRYIRSEDKAKYLYGDSSRYVPFAPNWIVKGNIIKDNNVLKFDFVDLVTIDGYTNVICDDK